MFLTLFSLIFYIFSCINIHNQNAEDNIAHSHTSIAYYVTFEMNDGEKKEFNVKEKEYSVVVEEDCGKLSYQGTRDIRFEK